MSTTQRGSDRGYLVLIFPSLRKNSDEFQRGVRGRDLKWVEDGIAHAISLGSGLVVLWIWT